MPLRAFDFDKINALKINIPKKSQEKMGNFEKRPLEDKIFNGVQTRSCRTFSSFVISLFFFFWRSFIIILTNKKDMRAYIFT